MRKQTLACAIFSAATLFGCSESMAPVDPVPPVLVVQVSTSGAPSALDADGYSVEIGDTRHSVSVSDSLAIDSLSIGPHSVKLSGVAANCTVVNVNPQLVEVTAVKLTIILAFYVSCQENTGTLAVSTTTTGSEIDSDRYRVMVFGIGGVLLDVGKDVSGQSSHLVRAGAVKVSLLGVARNCLVIGGPERNVNIAHAMVATVPYEVQCQATGSVQFTTTTTGDSPDDDGYHVELRTNNNYGDSFQLPPHGVKESGRLVPGNYTVRIWGMDLNCHTPFSGAVTVAASTAAQVRIDVTCAQPFELAYSAGSGAASDIYAINAKGEGKKTLVAGMGDDFDPAWAPDGRRVAFTSVQNGNSDIYVADADGTNRIRLTDDLAKEYRPAWSPDGKSVAFVSERDGNAEVYVMRSDGTNQVRVTTHSGADIDPAWAPDGNKIAFARSSPGGPSAIFLMNADGSGAIRLTQNTLGDTQPSWSPDGGRIAFRRATGPFGSDIYLMNADGSAVGALTQNLDLAADPDWSPDGKLIAFTAEEACDYYYVVCGQILVARIGDFPAGVTHINTNWERVYNPGWRPIK